MSDRIPSQRNDATETAIALIAKDDSSKLIVRAFRWQNEWYDVRKIGNWEVAKLDMDKTKLFDTVKEAVAAAGISYLSSPPGKKLTTIYGERFAMFSNFDTNDAKSPDLCKSLKCPADAVFEFVEENSFHIYYYEDEKPKNDTSECVTKVEAAAKTLEQAANSIKSTNQTSIVPQQSEPQTMPAPASSLVLTPDGLNARIESEYETKLHERINKKLIETKKNQYKTSEILSFELYEQCISDAYPDNDEKKTIFDRVIRRYMEFGWNVTTRWSTKVNAFPSLYALDGHFVELTFKRTKPNKAQP